VNSCAPGGIWNSCGEDCSSGATKTGGRRWGSNVGDGAPVLLGDGRRVEKRPDGVRKLGTGSIGVRGGQERRFHGEAEAAAAVLRR
jgi:hypothetical protein